MKVQNYVEKLLECFSRSLQYKVHKIFVLFLRNVSLERDRVNHKVVNFVYILSSDSETDFNLN